MILNKRKSCAITGHRPEKLKLSITDQEFIRFEEKIEQCITYLIENGVTTFYIGMARGADIWVGNVIVKLKQNNFKNLQLISIIPYEQQCSNWSEKDKECYYNLLEQCDVSVILASEYYENCYRDRNELLIRLSDCVLAVVFDEINGRSGTRMTLNMAEKAGLNRIILDVKNFSTVYINSGIVKSILDD